MKKSIKRKTNSKVAKPVITPVSKIKRGDILVSEDGKSEFLVIYTAKSMLFRGEYNMDVRCVKGKELDEVITGQLINAKTKVLVRAKGKK